MIIIQVWGHYRDARTTLRPSRRTSAKGYAYLRINPRALKRAADRCCYAGTDYPVLEAPPAPYGLWQDTEDGGLIAWSAERPAGRT